MFLPQSRADLLTRSVGAETVVYDPLNDTAHSLDTVTGQVFDLCDGQLTGEEAAARLGLSRKAVEAAVSDLTNAGLLNVPAGVSRRRVLMRGALVSGGALAATTGVLSVVAPTAFAANSATLGTPVYVPAGTTSGPLKAPAGASTLRVVAIGALGNGGGQSAGHGAVVDTTITLSMLPGYTSDAMFTFIAAGNPAASSVGGSPDGGAGGAPTPNNAYGYGGGGSSTAQLTTVSGPSPSRIVVAGGGGGAGSASGALGGGAGYAAGGYAAGAVAPGQSGSTYSNQAANYGGGGGGATQSHGAAGTAGGFTDYGVPGNDGSDSGGGGAGASPSNTSQYASGGGGGGGYAGGGGGGGVAGGGGGSSFSVAAFTLSAATASSSITYTFS